MTNRPLSRLYKFDTMVSENNLCQSWLGENSETNEKCFLKVSSLSSTFHQEEVRLILVNSFNYQKQLYSSNILRPVNKRREQGQLIIEYPKLDEKNWQTLSVNMFFKYFPNLLLQICMSVDYIHLMGLVHCDLKLDNFFVKTSELSQPELKLIDLDFLVPANSSPRAKILGTPGHIAPEILRNETIVPESDNYSLGVSLKSMFDNQGNLLDSSTRIAESELEKLKDFIELLIKPEPYERPQLLIKALYQRQIIDETDYTRAKKTLLSKQLLTKFKIKRKIAFESFDDLKSFFIIQNNILGIADEILHDIWGVYGSRKTLAFNAFKQLIANIELERYGDYWQIFIPDRAINDVYEFLRNGGVGLLECKEFERAGENYPIDRILENVRILKANGQFLKSLLILKNLMSGVNHSDVNWTSEDKETVFQMLGNLSVILNRPMDAIKYFRNALKSADGNLGSRLEILYELSHVYLQTNDLESAEKATKDGINKAKELEDSTYYLSFQRRDAWIMVVRGKYEQANDLLDQTIDMAIKIKNAPELSKSYVTLGILHWMKGHYENAEKSLKKAVKLTSDNDPRDDLISPFSNLCLLYFELAQYRKSIKYGKLAINSANTLDKKSRVRDLYIDIMFSFVRLGDFKKAEHWLQEFLAGRHQIQEKDVIRDFYFHEGFLFLSKGDLNAARESLILAQSLYNKKENNRNLGKIYQNLALISFYQGYSNQCNIYLSKATTIFGELSDLAAIAEINFIEKLNCIYKSSDNTCGNLEDSLKALVTQNCRYYSVLCLFYIILQTGRQAAYNLSIKYDQLTMWFSPSGVPLFDAVRTLLNGSNVSGGNDEINPMSLKSTYKTLLDSGYKFLCLLLCQEIAEYYLNNMKDKLANKFFLRSREIADELGNSYFSNVFSNRIAKLPAIYESLTKRAASLHKISQILINFGDIENALTNLIQYAIDETGAERGVLLLKDEYGNEYQVRSFINCDDSSLSDIADFSKAIPKMSADDFKPIIIENALDDRRTKTYKSVITHNILSVICAPLKFMDGSFGVLYLDHHTIPALFDREDLTIIKSMANFISVILSALQDFRNIRQTTKQLKSEMVASGIKNPFVTQNDIMLSMLDRLPIISQSKAHVLLQGESGTGKEILCHRIHDLSTKKDKPLLKLNCAAISNSLIESELFGVAKNTATGVDARDGKFSAANGGTLFLDEIADMPLDIQSKVLRVLEYQEFEKVGSNKTIKTNIRFIYATNKNLKELVKTGKFRNDLFHRINTISIEVPPLRERLDDIPTLIDHFIGVFSGNEWERPDFSHQAIQSMMLYAWPGNVRELKNTIEKYCILFCGRKIGLSDLPQEIQEAMSENGSSSLIARTLEKEKIFRLLKANNWNQSAVARFLKISLSTLRRKIKKYQIKKLI